MENIEIKARYSDLRKGGTIARSMGARYVGRYVQVDTYFRTVKGRLKLRESSGGVSHLIPYMRANTKGPKASFYQVLTISDPQTVKRIFSHLLGVSTSVRKVRRVYLKGNVRIHLDAVSKLGNFIEFEAVIKRPSATARKRARQKVVLFMRRFGIKPAHLVRQSYRELMKFGP